MDKITGSLPVNNTVTTESRQRDDSTVTKNQVGASVETAVDSVELTGTARKLQQAERLMADVGDIDKQKVAQVKAAIENGSYQIDAGKIADNLLVMDEALKK